MDLLRRHRSTIIFLIILPYLFIMLSTLFKSSPNNSNQIYPIAYQPKSSDTGRVLVLYVWVNTDVQSLGNLAFFVRHGIDSTQPADYYIILQTNSNETSNKASLPKLPRNAHYIVHINECYDFGTYGWFLKKKIANISLYKYFIFLNASIRGPFMVSYFPDDLLWWFNIFTRLLNDEVKLVGSTINCQFHPHVQSYLLVTDQIGLAILNNNKTGVFSCKKDYTDAVMNGEIGASHMILNANYQIASLQTKYKGWDFRKQDNWQCNRRISPIFTDNSLDGISHDPYELVFVKYKGKPDAFDTSLERRAHIYLRWILDQQINKTTKRIHS